MKWRQTSRTTASPRRSASTGSAPTAPIPACTGSSPRSPRGTPPCSSARPAPPTCWSSAPATAGTHSSSPAPDSPCGRPTSAPPASRNCARAPRRRASARGSAPWCTTAASRCRCRTPRWTRSSRTCCSAWRSPPGRSSRWSARSAGSCAPAAPSSTPCGTPATPTTAPASRTVTTSTNTAASPCTSSPPAGRRPRRRLATGRGPPLRGGRVAAPAVARHADGAADLTGVRPPRPGRGTPRR